MTNLVESPVRYPNIEVQLLGEDGNSITIISKVQTAMVRAGLPDDVISEFTDEVEGQDHSDMVRTVLDWVSVCGTDQSHLQ